MSLTDHQFLRIEDVRKIVPVSRPTIYRLMAKGDFPKNVTVGSCSFWLEDEIIAWKQQKIDERA